MFYLLSLLKIIISLIKEIKVFLRRPLIKNNFVLVLLIGLQLSKKEV